jgi:hypothetical protein
MTRLGSPPPEGTPINSPEWQAWKREVASWCAGVWDEWGSDPWIKPEPSVPIIKSKERGTQA